MSDVLIWGCVLLAFVCGYVLGTAHEHRRTVETVDAHWESLERTRATQPAPQAAPSGIITAIASATTSTEGR